MDFQKIKWREFSLIEVFETIQRGKRLKKDDHLEGNTPYASSTSLNNGIDGFIGNEGNVRIFKDCLTIANSGSVGSTFYQPFKVIASDHVTKLQNSTFNKYIYLFLASMVSRISDKYSFNREINDFRIKKEKVLLPVTQEGDPDYAFMENFMRKKEKVLLDRYSTYISEFESNIKQKPSKVSTERSWKEFKISEFFDFDRGDQNNMSELLSGQLPLVSAKNGNNAVKNFIQKNNRKLFKGKSLTLNNDGDGGAGLCYFQPFDYFLDTHVTALYPKKPYSKPVLIFLSNCISAQREKFGHGYSLNNLRLKQFKIMLPITKKGKPDFLYMEQHLQALEYEKLKAYLNYKTNKKDKQN